MNETNKGGITRDYQALNALRNELHQTARDKGWYDGELADRNVPELLCLIHSEVSECMEDFRKLKRGEPLNLDAVDGNGKPVGFPSEVADILIRVLDMCGYLNIDVALAVHRKAEFNKTRSYRHGGKNA